jgi:hypothetical protein
MRDAADAACLKHGRAFRHAHDLAAFVTDLDQVAARTDMAQGAQCKRQGNGAKGHGVGEFQEGALGLDSRRVPFRGHPCRQPGPRHFQHRLADVGKTQETEHRHQHRCYQQPGSGGRVPIAVAQPEMQAEAAMRPDHQQCEDLLDAGRRRIDPQRPGDEFVVDVYAGHRSVDAHADDVLGDQQRNEKAEQDLRGLLGGHLQRALEIKRAQHENDVDGRGAIEEDSSRKRTPWLGQPFEAGIGHIYRNEVQRQIGEMHGHEDHEDQAGDEARGAVLALPCLVAARGAGWNSGHRRGN